MDDSLKNSCQFFGTKKSKIKTIAERNRIVNNISNIIHEKNNFLMLGHKDPDEDCIASMVAFCLLLRKFYKRSTILLYKEYHHKFPYLMEMCKYNHISVVESEKYLENNFNVIVILDTPKPAMVEGGEKITALINDKNIIKIELDHHLGADSGYIGDNNYCFVDESSSTCELIGYLTHKLKKKEIINQYDIHKMFSRNFIVALVTGMISDTKMGKYLKSERQRRSYHFFSTRFNRLLLHMTKINSNNFFSIEDIFAELEKLSAEEIICYKYFGERKKRSDHIAYTVIDKNDIDYFYKNFKKELIASVARHLADDLAEESGYLSLIVYYDNPEESDLIQFRMRRTHTFAKIDLRDVIKELNIEDGGGHPGAVGFRVKQNSVSDLKKFTEELINKIENILKIE
ncbi:MAG: DHH family phosphoesterase [Spirochaetaceae bacterium]|nr:DHH family phosphoesterase [Spirochaetaceae bacterium]